MEKGIVVSCVRHESNAGIATDVPCRGAAKRFFARQILGSGTQQNAARMIRAAFRLLPRPGRDAA
jgi:hypothetical protein